MAQPSIKLDYSTDGGVTFSGSATAFTFQRARVYKMTTFNENPVAASQRKTQVSISYLRAELETTWKETSPDFAASASDANTAWAFLQAWVAAPIRRVYWDTTNFTSAGGYTQWNTSNNTNYVNIVEYEPSFIASDWENTLALPKNRFFRIVIETRDAI